MFSGASVSEVEGGEGDETAGNVDGLAYTGVEPSGAFFLRRTLSGASTPLLWESSAGRISSSKALLALVALTTLTAFLGMGGGGGLAFDLEVDADVEEKATSASRSRSDFGGRAFGGFVYLLGAGVGYSLRYEGRLSSLGKRAGDCRL